MNFIIWCIFCILTTRCSADLSNMLSMEDAKAMSKEVHRMDPNQGIKQSENVFQENPRKDIIMPSEDYIPMYSENVIRKNPKEDVQTPSADFTPMYSESIIQKNPKEDIKPSSEDFTPMYSAEDFEMSSEEDDSQVYPKDVEISPEQTVPMKLKKNMDTVPEEVTPIHSEERTEILSEEEDTHMHPRSEHVEMSPERSIQMNPKEGTIIVSENMTTIHPKEDHQIQQENVEMPTEENDIQMHLKEDDKMSPEQSVTMNPTQDAKIVPENMIQIHPKEDHQIQPENTKIPLEEEDIQMHPKEDDKISPEQAAPINSNKSEKIIQTYPEEDNQIQPENIKIPSEEEDIQMHPKPDAKMSPEETIQMNPNEDTEIVSKKSTQIYPKEDDSQIQPEKAFSTALIFNQRTEQLQELSEENADKKCRLCLIACPASTELDVKFNEIYSIAKNSIFLKNVVDEGHEYAKNIELDVCKVSFKPSVVRDGKKLTYETGYEFYYDESKASMPCKRFNDYVSITATDPIKRSEYDQEFPVIQYEVDNCTKFIIPDHRTLVFNWIKILSFKFNRSKHRIKVNLKNDAINDHETMNKCEDYDLGHELYQPKNADVDFFHSEPDRMFEKIYVLPPMDDSAKEAYGSIERMHIIPMMFLHTKAAKLASCTLMNTVPVWSEIVERVNYVDRYLYALFRYWSPNVKIIFGVSEELKVDLENSATFWKNIFFPARKGLISIPRLIYRVVEYRMPVGNEFRLYNIAIIIHNNPSDAVSDKKRLCPVPTYGWEDIRNDDPEKGLSYACAMVPSINMRLGAYDKYDFPKGYHGTLQLVIMPVVKNGDYSGHVDVRGDIMNKMKELFPDQDIPQT